MDSQGKGTGNLTKRGDDGIRTGPDKLREMKKAMQKNGHSKNIITVYVGDSNTDLPCLLFADVGIIIGDGGSLIDTCKRVGIEVISGASLRQILYTPNERRDEKRLYHFHDWHAIAASGLID